ncbi:hypothetical protein Btru_030507 [Bulinus truncatus]|nr:hypothetical protein Btru_030507 [Bulinus truncatus]
MIRLFILETDSCEPEANSYEPETNRCEPETSSCEPETNNFEPETNSCEPETNSFEPETNRCGPETNSCEPETNRSDDLQMDMGDSFFVKRSCHQFLINSTPHQVILAAFLAGLVALTGGQMIGGNNCQQTWLRSATACVQNSSININNLRYIASNGTEGQSPMEGIATFKARACVVRPQIDVCGQAITQRLYNSTLCVTQVERQTILSQSQALFGAFYDSCSFPCRFTLEKDIRQCYNYVNLSPSQLSDLALARTTAIGDNADQVHQFCLNRDSLAQCIRQKALACPDSARVLAELGIELGSFELGADILCRNKGVYLSGLHCFRNPIPEVRMCFQTWDSNLQALMMVAPQPTADQISLLQYCNFRLEHVNCEMQAWARHQYQTCSRTVTGMRTELECELIPKQCMNAFPNLYGSLCSKMNFYYEDRRPYNAGHSVVPSCLFALMVTALVTITISKHLCSHL